MSSVSTTASNAVRSGLQGFYDVSKGLWSAVPKPRSKGAKTAWIVFGVLVAYFLPILQIPVITTTDSDMAEVL